MSSIYDRFKPTPLATIKERQQEVSKITNQYEQTSGDGLKRKLLNQDGTYKIRMYPTHDVPGATACEPKVIYWIPAYVNEKDDQGQWIKLSDGSYKKRLGQRPVFNAKVHGGADFDLIDTYIELTKRKADR